MGFLNNMRKSPAYALLLHVLSFLLLVTFSFLLFFPVFYLCNGRMERSGSPFYLGAAAKSQETDRTQVSRQENRDRNTRKKK